MPQIPRQTYDGKGNVIDTGTVEVSQESLNNVSIQDKLRQQLAANKTFLDLGTPTAAQQAAQVKRLTRECNGLIRLAIQALDADDA